MILQESASHSVSLLILIYGNMCIKYEDNILINIDGHDYSYN